MSELHYLLKLSDLQAYDNLVDGILDKIAASGMACDLEGIANEQYETMPDGSLVVSTTIPVVVRHVVPPGAWSTAGGDE